LVGCGALCQFEAVARRPTAWPTLAQGNALGDRRWEEKAL
jgi:hypothetical protein